MLRRCSIAEARNQLARLIHDVELGSPVELTRRGKPVAILLSWDEYERGKGTTPTFWEALTDWRCHADLEHLEVDEVFEGVRSDGGGREVSW